ncbi:hypothetical protein FOZ63_005649, partial [Perkinsus olseni]
MAATPDTGIDLSPGEYVGYANDVTKDCWPEMATVFLHYAMAPGVTVLSYLDHDSKGALIASGRTNPLQRQCFCDVLETREVLYRRRGPYLSTRQSTASRSRASSLLYQERSAGDVPPDTQAKEENQLAELPCLPRKGRLELDQQQICKNGEHFGGVARLSFDSLENWASTRFPYIPIYGSVRPPFACHWFNYEDDPTPDLATAEGMMNIYPLRVDNIRLCIEGSHWTLHLGEDTDDGVGKKA